MWKFIHSFYKKSAIFLLLSLLVFVLPSVSAAATDTTAFQSKLESDLSAVNSVYKKAEESKSQIANLQKQLDTLNTKISSAQTESVALQSQVASEMQAIQESGFSRDFITVLLSSSSLTDFLTRFSTLQALLQQQKGRADDLTKVTAELKSSQTKLTTEKAKLEAAQTTYQQQATDLESQIASLKGEIAANQAEVTQIVSSGSAPAGLASYVAEPSMPSASDGTAGQTATATTPITTGGQSMTVVTTGYATDGKDPNVPGHITATGIDLLKNPMVIAVDPSVIPLGKMVEIPGYGVAIAGDTGGAIKGYRVDLHFATTAQALDWGRRTVQVTVLN